MSINRHHWKSKLYLQALLLPQSEQRYFKTEINDSELFSLRLRAGENSAVPERRSRLVQNEEKLT